MCTYNLVRDTSTTHHFAFLTSLCSWLFKCVRRRHFCHIHGAGYDIINFISVNMWDPSDFSPKWSALTQDSGWLAWFSLMVGSRGSSCLPGSVQKEQKLPRSTSDPNLTLYLLSTRHMGWEGGFPFAWTISCPGKPTSWSLVTTPLFPCDRCGGLPKKYVIFISVANWALGGFF